MCAEQSLWSVQVLTPDYLIDGNFDSKDVGGLSFFSMQTGSNVPVASLQLSSALLQPTGNLAMPITPVAKWITSFNDAFVGVIPLDEPSTAHALKNNKAPHPVPADVYVGPYLIRGIVMSPDKNLEILGDVLSFLVQNARITCLTSGAQMTEIRAPNMLVRTLLLQGIAPHG